MTDICCRYYMGDYDPDEAMEAYYAQAQRRACAMGVTMVRSGEVRPTDIAPVIAPSAKNRKPGAFPMRWGFKHPERDVLILNTRSETALDKLLFADSARARRCLVPASCYFEWKKEGKDKIKFAIKPMEEQLYLAGLYLRLPSAPLPCFTILTMEAVGGLEAIHSRMPVMIPQNRICDWLSIDQPFDEIIKCALLETKCKIA